MTSFDDHLKKYDASHILLICHVTVGQVFDINDN